MALTDAARDHAEAAASMLKLVSMLWICGFIFLVLFGSGRLIGPRDEARDLAVHLVAQREDF